MKTIKQLTREELQAVNGGSGSTYSSGATISSTTDSLLSVTLETQMGDSYRKTTISVGNNIDAQVKGVFETSEQ